MKRRDALRLLGLLPFSLLGACTPKPRIETEGFLLYGMLTQLSLPAGAPVPLPAALQEMEAIFKREYAILHPWQDSPLTRLNAALRTGEWVELDPRLRDIIERGRELETATGGVFSPAVGALVKLWGFHSNEPDAERAPPPQAEIEHLMHPPPRMSDLDIDGGRIRCRNPNVQLDFNAMAEAWAAERSARRLAELGLHDALIDASGDLLVLGQAGRRPWKVAIQDPFSEGPLGWVELRGKLAAFTSGSYRKRFTWQGKSYSHIIDPRTGWPSHGLVGASVIAPDALLANAAATGLIAAGPADAPALIQHMKLDHVLLVEEHGHLLATPAMAGILHRLRDDLPLSILGQGT